MAFSVAAVNVEHLARHVLANVGLLMANLFSDEHELLQVRHALLGTTRTRTFVSDLAALLLRLVRSKPARPDACEAMCADVYRCVQMCAEESADGMRALLLRRSPWSHRSQQTARSLCAPSTIRSNRMHMTQMPKIQCMWAVGPVGDAFPTYCHSPSHGPALRIH